MATAKTKASGQVIRAPRVAPRSSRRVRAETPEEQKTTMLHVRVDERLKAEATATLDGIGISLSEALRVFLRRVVSEQAFPFRLEVPNATTRAAMEEARRSSALPRFTSADELFDDFETGRVR